MGGQGRRGRDRISLVTAPDAGPLTAGLTAVLRQPGVLRAAAPTSAAVQGAPENGPADAGTLMQNSVYTAGEEAAYGEAAYGDTAYEEAEAVYDEAAYGAAEKNAVPASGTVPESAAEEGPAAPAAAAADVPRGAMHCRKKSAETAAAAP